MSLINTMLKDLETRQTTPSGDQSQQNDLYRNLRPVGRRRRPYRTVMLSVSLITMVLATATLLFARGHWDPSILSTKIAQWGGVFGQGTTNGHATNVTQVSDGKAAVATSVSATSNVPAVEIIQPLKTAALPETPQPSESIEVVVSSKTPASQIAHDVPAKAEVKTKGEANKRADSKAKVKQEVKKQAKATVAKKKTKKPVTSKKLVSVKKEQPVEVQKTKKKLAIVSLDQTATDLGQSGDQGIVERKLRTLTPADEAERAYRDAVDSLKQNRVGDAQERLRFAIAADPQHTEAHELLAGLLLRRGSLGEAEQLLNGGRAANPEHYRFAQLLARIYIQRGASKQALTLLEESQPYATTDAEFLGFLAALYQRDGQHDRAIEAYGRAVTINPQQGQWWLGLGISFEAESNWSAAQQAYRRAVAGGGLSNKLGRYARERLASVQRNVTSSN